MPICKECGGAIPTRLHIDGKTKKVSNHRIYCFVCSPEGSHNMRKPYEGFNVCKKCGAPTKKAVVCGSCRVTAWRQKRKLKAIEYKGGKCILCGFSKYNSALEFHHLDPSQKDFALVSKTISWERMKEELDKCVLLCSNCHHAVHSKEVELPKDLIPQ